MKQRNSGLYLMLISVHGLIRARDAELGRDADTGGQIKYVVELVRALSANPGVSRVDLVTRRIIDARLDDSYAREREPLTENANIIRLTCGPRRYLRKEALWPYLDIFVDNILQHVRRIGRVPDVIHAHYADAGYVATRVAQLLGVPLIFTGHSLGREKRRLLLEKGLDDTVIEQRYNISQRIEAEEVALGNAELVVASTRQEIETQYRQYENYQPERHLVIPPGVDLSRFHPPGRVRLRVPIGEVIDAFLAEPAKPLILALSRADERKNIATLIQAYGENAQLREHANLVVIAGNRDDIETMDKGASEVLQNLLYLIDRYDLYGKAAYPKHHAPDDVPDLYRLAAQRRGVFINPALTEPFGLTLIEAAASGLPVVSTNDGGPRDIIKHCNNGLLIDPLDAAAMGNALLDAITDSERWSQWAKNGVRGASRHYSWSGHVNTYLGAINKKLSKKKSPSRFATAPRERLPTAERMLVCDIDNTLIGDETGLQQLMEIVTRSEGRIGLAVATGRRLESTLKILKEWDVPVPDLLITAVGSEIYYGHSILQDENWRQHIDYRWKPAAVRDAIEDIAGLRLQPFSEQRQHKISYYVDSDHFAGVRDLAARLRKLDLHVKIIYSHESFLDILPVRASKGLAVRYFAMKWGLHPERILVAGDSGNDEEMLRGSTLGVVVGNHSPELQKLQGQPQVYFAEGHHAWGIIEGIRHYGFLDDMKLSAGA